MPEPDINQSQPNQPAQDQQPTDITPVLPPIEAFLPGNVDEARANGHSDQEIRTFLAPKIEIALNRGFKQEEIDNFLGFQKPNEKPMPPSSVIARLQQGNMLERFFAATAQGAKTGFGSEKLGFNKENEQFLIDIGILSKPGQSVVSDHITRPAIQALDAAGRAVSALIGAGTFTLGQVATEIGASDSSVASFNRDTLSMGNIALLVTGMMPVASLRVGSTGTPVLHDMGGLPKPGDFAATARVFGEGNVSKVTPILEQLYKEKGVLPTEVIVDATSDVTISQDLLAGRIPKRYGGGTAPGERALPIIEDQQGSGGGNQPPKTTVPPKSEGATGKPDLEGAKARFTDKIVIGAKKGKSLTFDKFYTATINRYNPLRKFTKEATGKRKTIDVPVEENPEQLAQLSSGDPGVADHFIKFGTLKFDTLEAVGPSFESILGQIGKKDLHDFRLFATAKRVVEQEKKGLETGFNIGDAGLIIKDGEKKFGKIFDQSVNFQNETLKFLKDGGLLTDDALSNILKTNKDFIPFFRILDEKIVKGGRKTGGGLQGKNPVRKFKGSTANIIDPVESVIKNTYAYVAFANRNRVGKAFLELARKSGRFEEFAKKIKDPIRPVRLNERELKKLLTDFVRLRKQTRKSTKTTEKATSSAGVGDQSKMTSVIKGRVEEALKNRGFSDGETKNMIASLASKTDETATTIEKIVKTAEKTVFVPELDTRIPIELATVFRAFKTPLERNQIRVFENGIPTKYEVDPDLAAAFKNLDQRSANLLVTILAKPASLLRAGAVLAPEFTARNVIFDNFTAFATVPGFKPIYDPLIGFASVIGKGKSYRQFLKSGGANSALVSIDKQFQLENIAKLNRSTKVLERGINVITSPVRLLRTLTEIGDNSTRVGVFRRTLIRETKKGTPQKAALLRAAAVAREGSLDFQRIGAQTRAINMMSAFFNVALQGPDRIARALAERPVATSVKLIGSITVPSILLWFHNKDDKRIKELPIWQRDAFWLIPTDKWRPAKADEVFPDHLTRIRNGVREINDGTIYRIPKPPLTGQIFGSLVERILDEFVKKDPTAFENFGETLAAQSAIPVIPTFAIPLVEQEANRSLFTGNPIFPLRTEKLLPEYRYNDYTTDTAKMIGRIFGAFPGLDKLALTGAPGSFAGGVARALTTPALVENYIRAWTGGLGKYVLQLSDVGLSATDITNPPPRPERTLSDIPVVKAFVVRYPSASVSVITKLFDRLEANTARFNTIKNRFKEGDFKTAEFMLGQNVNTERLQGIKKTLSDLSQVIHNINQNRDYSPSDKRQLIDTMYFNMIEMARQGNAILDQIDQDLSELRKGEGPVK